MMFSLHFTSADVIHGPPRIRQASAISYSRHIAVQFPVPPHQFLPEHLHFLRGVDADANLVATNGRHGDLDVVADEDGFTDFSCEDQNLITLLPVNGLVCWLL